LQKPIKTLVFSEWTGLHIIGTAKAATGHAFNGRFLPAPHRKTAPEKDDCWFYYGLDVVNTSIASYILAEAKLVDMHVVVSRRLPPSRRDYFVVLPASGYDACQLRHRRQNTTNTGSIGSE